MAPAWCTVEGISRAPTIVTREFPCNDLFACADRFQAGSFHSRIHHDPDKVMEAEPVLFPAGAHAIPRYDIYQTVLFFYKTKTPALSQPWRLSSGGALIAAIFMVPVRPDNIHVRFNRAKKNHYFF